MRTGRQRIIPSGLAGDAALRRRLGEPLRRNHRNAETTTADNTAEPMELELPAVILYQFRRSYYRRVSFYLTPSEFSLGRTMVTLCRD
jgi:hypothetical protein